MSTALARETNAVLNALQRSAFATGLSEAAIKALAQVAVERHYAPGDVLYKEGQPAEGFFLLLSGRVNFTISVHARRPKFVGWVEKGNAVGLSALVGERPHAVTAMAALKVHLLFFPKAGLKELLAEYPELWLRISILLSSGVQQAYSHRISMCRGGSAS